MEEQSPISMQDPPEPAPTEKLRGEGGKKLNTSSIGSDRRFLPPAAALGGVEQPKSDSRDKENIASDCWPNARGGGAGGRKTVLVLAALQGTGTTRMVLV